ncbi:hypothetical protein L7F22_012894 [Adiantum nelumboides]|nr:hypothetical protein [Adiantum nelumboides]
MSNYLRCMKPGGQVLMNIIPLADKHIKVPDNNSPSSRKQASTASRSKVSSYVAPQFTDAHQHCLMQVCTRMMLSDNNSPSYEDIDQPNLMMMMMQLENILGSTDVMYGNHIQDQASATCCIPDPSFNGNSQLATPADAGQSHFLHLPPSSSRQGVTDAYHEFDGSPQTNAAQRLDKLMAEYNELLQSSSPKMLEEGTLSAFADTLSDTASSSTSSSASSAPLHLLNHEYLNYIIKPGGYVAGLLSPQEELVKCVKPMFEVSDLVTGTANDSICSSNDLSSIQELVTCSMSDPSSCNNGIYPTDFSSYTPNEPCQIILDSRLSDSLACLLPPVGTYYQNHLQR